MGIVVFFRHDNEICCLRTCVFVCDCKTKRILPVISARTFPFTPQGLREMDLSFCEGTYQHLPCVHSLCCSTAEPYYFTPEHKSQNNYHIENVVQNDIYNWPKNVYMDT